MNTLIKCVRSVLNQNDEALTQRSSPLRTTALRIPRSANCGILSRNVTATRYTLGSVSYSRSSTSLKQVTAAAKKAMEDYKRAHPEVKDDDLKVDLPPPVAGPSNNRGAAHAAALPRVAQPPPQPFYVDGMRRLGNAFMDIGAAFAPPPPPIALPPFRDVAGMAGAAELQNVFRVLDREQERAVAMGQRIQQDANIIYRNRRVLRNAARPPPPPAQPAVNVYVNGVQVAGHAAVPAPPPAPGFPGGLFGGAPLFFDVPAAQLPPRPVVAARADAVARRPRARR